MVINFIGGFFPKDKLPEYVENSTGEVHYAANALQQSIITGLNLHEGLSTNLITAPFVEHFPSYRKIFIKKEQTKDYTIAPFINLKILDSITKTFSLRRIIKREIKNNREDIILIYGMFEYFLMSIPANYKNKVCLVIPDLPRMMGGDMTKLKIKIYIWLIEKLIDKNLHKVDCFVFISKYMKEYIDVGDKPWVVIEGIYNSQQLIEEQKKEEDIVILYTGTLDRRYGIIDLLRSFSLIKEQNFQLWICGEGLGKKDVENAASKDNRIKYLGQISNMEAQILQRRATILINPRKNDMEFTKFSFPSKTMEYLASGTPTIMYKLDGIPQEYYPHFFRPSSNEPEAMKDAILKVANLSVDERQKFGNNAKEFVLKFKNPEVQVGKIITMLNNIS